MESKEPDNTVKEMLLFAGVVTLAAKERYLKIKEIFSVRYSLPEIDFIRDEIGKCFVNGSDHACILLTNMLLERYCKEVLIYKMSGFTFIKDLTTIEKDFAPALKKYKNLSLEQTLQECKKEGVINEDELKLFLIYKERFRDGFFHSDSSRVLKGHIGSFVTGTLSTGEITSPKDLVLQNVPPFAGIGVKMFAEANSYGYFISVENLIRKTLRHYINEKYEINLEIIKPQP